MDAKFERLRESLRETSGVLVAFSRGVDFSFLLKVARMVLSNRAIAVTASSPTAPPGEIQAAEEFARALGCQHLTFAEKRAS